MEAVKQPGETRAFEYDFGPLLDAFPINAIVSALAVPKEAGAPALVKEGELFAGQSAWISWSGGGDGHVYLTTVKVSDSQGGEYELEGEINVRDLAFIVPDIPASPYLSADDYVARFGQTETVRLTDEAGTGVIDKTKLGAAIADATEVTESYLAGRYNLPLASIPLTIRRIVADLAREALHRNRPTPAVTDAADRARSMLKDYAAGRAVLLLEGEEEPERNDNAAPVYSQSMDARVFNAEKLEGF